MNVLELYAVDAELAFDPAFCFLNSGATACTTGSYTSLNGLTTIQQLQYFQSVGLGNTNLCYTGPGLQTSATGNCQYSQTIDLQHGYH
ncbi:MAG: hypothetical protein WBX38_09350 [Candidatus Sulfotelmatobacter sp.]